MTGIRIALPSKESSSTFSVGVPALSGALTSHRRGVRNAVCNCRHTGAAACPRQSGGAAPRCPQRRRLRRYQPACSRVDVPTAALGDGCQAIVLPPDGIHALPVVVPAVTAGSTVRGGVHLQPRGCSCVQPGIRPRVAALGGRPYRNADPRAVGGQRLSARGGSHSVTLTLFRQRNWHRRLVASMLVLLGIGLASCGGCAPNPRDGCRTAALTVPRWLRVAADHGRRAVVLALVAVGFQESGASRVQFAVAVLSGGCGTVPPPGAVVAALGGRTCRHRCMSRRRAARWQREP